MSSHVEELATHLAKLQSRSTKEVSDQKAGYEQKLRLQKTASAAIEHRNAAIQSHIGSLRNDTLAVRTRTNALVKGSRKLVALLNAVHDNFTEAGVVVTSVLQEAQEKMSNSSKLQVLQELSEMDARRKQESENQHRFDEIERPHGFSLLQIAPNSQKEAQELVQSLMASLGSLSEEQNVSTASLQKNFEDEWDLGVKRQNDLLDMQMQLNATEANEVKRNAAVHAAFDHALSTNTRLKERVHAVRRFAHKVGSRMIPEAQKAKKQTPKFFSKHRKGIHRVHRAK